MCEHWTLICSISPYATASSHHAYTDSQLVTAATGKRKLPGSYLTNNALEAFPAPLILPGDDIDCDPKYPPQSFRSWLNLGVRNHVTSRRNVIYLAAAPDIDVDVAFMRDWQHPRLGRNTRRNANPMGADGMDVNVIAAYLRTFYHGLEVKVLPQRLYFTSWEDESSARRGCSTQNQKCQQVGLSTGGEIVRIRVRSTPPADTVSPPQLFTYPYQLNLNDLTDVAMDILPSDAYALLLMTAHDIYESDDDDFCCGRAWGASRVAIVSSARYHTIMDDLHDVDGEHVWPASHCKAFVDEISAQGQAGNSDKPARKAMKGSETANVPTLSPTARPLQKALNAHLHSFPTGITPDAKAASTLLFRLCRTTSHELGHCFGLDHCMYKACVMQGSGSVAEDMRQPPYLCPVCDRKIAWAILQGDSARKEQSSTTMDSLPNQEGRRRARDEFEDCEGKISGWKRGRSLAMKEFCERQRGSFTALAAWCDAMLDIGAEES